MKPIKYGLILFFSLAVISCSSSSDNGSSTTSTTTTTDDDDTTDTTAPVIAEVTAVTTPTNDSTPNYTFSSDEAGTITYGGSCSSSTTSAISGNNTKTLVALSDGTYSNCTIIVTDSTGNASNTLAITSFSVDAAAPTVLSTSPADSNTSISENDNISVIFSEAMNTMSVTTNSSGTACTGTFQVSSDSFSTCVQMLSSPSVSNSDMTFSVKPSSSLSYSTTYKIKVTTGVEDKTGNNMSSENVTGTGFTTNYWIKQFGSSSYEEGLGVAVDSSENIYVTGFTEGALDNNTNSGERDIFLVKYNSRGVYQWTQQMGTSSYDEGSGVAVDSSDNIYVTGYTKGGLDNNSNSGSSDIFLVKYNSSGSKQWTQQLGTSSSESGYGVIADSSNNIYVTGYTVGDLDSNTNSGSKDLFIVKYNSSGSKQWTQQLGSSLEDYGLGVAVDSSDNFYVTGYTSGDLDNNTNSGGRDYFLVKYYDNGTKQWTQQTGTSASDYAKGVVIDSSDNIYVTGQTAGGLDNNTNSGSIDIFLAKYYDNGTKQWTQQLGTSSSEIGYGVIADSSNNVYVAGYTTGGLDGNTNSGSSDLFLVKYNSSGSKQWTRQLGTSSYDSVFGVTVDSSNNIYLTGKTDGRLDNNTNSGTSDIFLVKYNSSGVKQ